MTDTDDLIRRVRAELSSSRYDAELDPDRVLSTTGRRIRRRKAAIGIGVPTVATVLIASAAVVAAELPGSDDPARPLTTPTPTAGITGTTTTTGTEPAAAFDDWVPPQPSLDAPARAGTMIYRSCQGKTCTVGLGRPGQDALPLTDLRPDLAATIEVGGLAGATLSWNARLLGLRVAGGYEIHRLDASPGASSVYKVAPGPPGSQWEAVGWTEASRSVVLALYQGQRVLRYSVFVEDGQSFEYQPPANLGLLPIGADDTKTVAVTEPVDISRPAADRPVVGSYPQSFLNLADTDGAKQGFVWHTGSRADLSKLLRTGETLAGPRGVPVRIAAPSAAQTQNSGGMTAVYSAEEGSLILSAMIGGSGTSGRRYELPTSAAGQWSLLVPLDENSIAAARSTPGSTVTDLFRITVGQEPQLLSRFPAESTALIPGMPTAQ